MSDRISFTLLKSTICLILLLLVLAPVAHAEEGEWEFGAGLYGWLPNITGTLAFEVPGVGNTVVVDADDLLENLSMTVQGTVAAQKNGWGVYGDVIYLKETKSGQKTLPVGEGITLSSEFGLNNWIVNFGGLYQVAKTPGGGTFNIILGARYFYAKSTLAISGSGPLEADGTHESISNIWNGIIGANGRIALGKRWFIPYHLDMGAGDSDFTWQGQTGINYAWNWGGLILSYRYLDFNQDDSSLVREMSMGGPELGIYFDF